MPGPKTLSHTSNFSAVLVWLRASERISVTALGIWHVMAGRSRLKDGVASARLCPAIHVFCAV